MGIRFFYKNIFFGNDVKYILLKTIYKHMETTMTTALETEHVKWLVSIDLFKQQLKLMDKEIAEFVSGKYPKSLAPRIEQFQNQIIRQREVLDILRHDIKSHENEIERMTNFALEYLRDRVTREHIGLKTQYKRFVELFLELELDFHDFIS
jgi:pyruvate/oxaloacetate carboxyltransferase